MKNNYLLFQFTEENKTNPAEFQSNGITAEGVKYTFLRAQDNMILGKIIVFIDQKILTSGQKRLKFLTISEFDLQN